MYRLISKDYAIADIERFSALSIRRGSTLASVGKTPDDLRIVTGAWLLSAPPSGARPCFEEKAAAFLKGPGDWLAETPEALIAEAADAGLLTTEGETLVNQLAPRPGVTAARLVDELESARAILAERRLRAREKLQVKNRTVNSGAPVTDRATDERFMREALEEAKKAAEAGEVPVGAVLVLEGEIIARAGNRTLRDGDPTAHAEMLALRAGAARTGNHRLGGAALYVTLEPCPMCAGGIVQARPSRLVFGAGDPRMGAAGGALSLFDLPGINHRPWVTRGVLADEAAKLLTDFFAARRGAEEQGE